MAPSSARSRPRAGKPPDTPAWPADAVERRSVASLTPYARNARLHSEGQVAEIAASIREWGWTMPVLVDESGGIIAGHGRVLAAQLLGLAEVPVMVARGWSADQKRAYVIADNKIGLNAAWDDALLALELGELQSTGLMTGFDGGELKELFAKAARRAGFTDPNAAGPAPAAPVSRLGDVWLLGESRIVCGDCTDPKVVDLALAGAKPHLMVTDPPYGVNYDPAWRQAAGVASKGAAVGKVLNDDRADWREAWALFPGAVAYVWHGGLHWPTVEASLVSAGFGIRAQIVWVKTRPVFSRGAYHWQHEPALYGVREGEEDHWRFVPEHEVAGYVVREGETSQWSGGRKQSTVWNIEHLKSDTGHGTQKPVECMRRPIENNSKAGDAVYEPFSGSGTTLIAAEMTARRCHAIELSPAYVDVAVKRWEEFTREAATLEADGRTFEAVSAAGARDGNAEGVL